MDSNFELADTSLNASLVGLPDYEHPLYTSPNFPDWAGFTEFTANQRCWLIGMGYDDNNNGSSQLTVNDIRVFQTKSIASFYIPLNVGDTVKKTGNNKFAYKIYPMK